MLSQNLVRAFAIHIASGDAIFCAAIAYDEPALQNARLWPSTAGIYNLCRLNFGRHLFLAQAGLCKIACLFGLVFCI